MSLVKITTFTASADDSTSLEPLQPPLLSRQWSAGEHPLSVTGPVGALQVVLNIPQSARPGVLALICHPHSLMGGSLDNKVVFTAHRACRDLGLITLRFNFRGVGNSVGEFDHGEGEQQDLLALLAWARTELAVNELVLVGFSFGAYVAACAWPQAIAAGWHGRHLLLLAPPVTRFPLHQHVLSAGTQVIYGDADEVVAPAAIATWLAQQAAVLNITVMAAASHFFHGQLSPLKALISAAVEESLHD